MLAVRSMLCVVLSGRRRLTRFLYVTGVQTCALPIYILTCDYHGEVTVMPPTFCKACLVVMKEYIFGWNIQRSVALAPTGL